MGAFLERRLPYIRGNASFNQPRRLLVVKLLAVAALLAVSVTACSKTESGDLEVEKPVVGTQTDTLNVPTVEVGTDTAQVAVPNVDVRKDTASIRVPTVKVKK
jgi:hypothetical protein